MHAAGREGQARFGRAPAQGPRSAFPGEDIGNPQACKQGVAFWTEISAGGSVCRERRP